MCVCVCVFVREIVRENKTFIAKVEVCSYYLRDMMIIFNFIMPYNLIYLFYLLKERSI